MNTGTSPKSLPKGWVLSALGDITEQINPGFPSGKHNQEGRGVPHLRPMNVSRSGEIDLTEVKYVETHSYDCLQEGDVLFNNTNSPALVGKTACVRHNTNWAYSNHMTRLRVNRNVANPAWVAYGLHLLFLQGFFRMRCRHHVNQASIGSKFLSDNVPLPIPPLSEQQRIVAKIEELFSNLDAGVASLRTAKALLKRYRQSVLNAAFTGNLTERWREARPTGTDALPGTSDTIRPRAVSGLQETSREAKFASNVLPSMRPSIPHSWQWIRLGECTDLITKGESPKWQGYDYVDDGVPFVRSENVLWGRVHMATTARVPVSFHRKLRRSSIRDGDLLVNLVGASIGRCGIVPEGVKEANINQAVGVIRTSSLLAPYLMYLLLSPQFQRIIHTAKVETARANISLGDLRSLMVPVPPVAEQQEIVRRLEHHLLGYDTMRHELQQCFGRTGRLRHSVLMAAFRGELLHQVPGNKPPPGLPRGSHADV